MPTVAALNNTFQTAFNDFNTGCNNPTDPAWVAIQSMLDLNAVACAITHGIVVRGRDNVLNFLKASGGKFTVVISTPVVAPDGTTATITGRAQWRDNNHPDHLIHYVFSFVDNGAGGWSIFTLSATGD